jgi:hypothetical protein
MAGTIIRVAGYLDLDGKKWELQRHIPSGKHGEFVLSYPGSGTRSITREQARALHASIPDDRRERRSWEAFFD